MNAICRESIIMQACNTNCGADSRNDSTNRMWLTISDDLRHLNNYKIKSY